MPNEIVYLSGKCKYARLIQPDTKFDPHGKWSLVLYPDAKSLSIINRLKETTDGVQGIMNHLKMDEEGSYMSFSRPVQREFKGVVKAFTPPEILDKDNKPAPSVRIGDGSDVTIKVEVRTYPIKFQVNGKGRATRLISVRVDNLVPFDESQYNNDQKEMVAGLKDQPGPNF